MKPKSINFPEVTSTFMDVCDRIAYACPDTAIGMARLKKEAENNPLFPAESNLLSLLVTYNQYFDKNDLLCYIHTLATTLHCLSGYTLSLMQG